MSSLKAKDRVSLCSFTFSDGRRCRTPRAAKHPHFCFYHAQKEARDRAAKKLGKDLAYFFSGDYVSGCDLSTALARLIPAVVRGDVKPRTARTVAYLAQTLMQAIHIGQHEYINAFGTEDWRNSIRNSVNGNYNHRFPPTPEQHVVAGLQTGTPPPQPASCSPSNPPSESPQPQPASPPPQPAVIPNPVAPLANGGEGPASSPTTATSAVPIALATPAEFVHVVAGLKTGGSSPRPAAAPQTGPSGLPVLAPLPPPKPEAPAAQANNPPRPAPSTPQPTPNRNTYALHFDHNCRLRIDGKPF